SLRGLADGIRHPAYHPFCLDFGAHALCLAHFFVDSSAHLPLPQLRKLLSPRGVDWGGIKQQTRGGDTGALGSKSLSGGIENERSVILQAGYHPRPWDTFYSFRR
ncbi:unnamed protein product, partial [Ectocarpus fasciculatus]